MKDYKKTIEKEGKDPKFYVPVLRLFEKNKSPLSIEQVAESLDISYYSAKFRLHKLIKFGLLIRTKRGYYCLFSNNLEYTKMPKPFGKLVFVNGGIRVMGSSNGLWITIYNSKFGKLAKNKYCNVQYVGENKFIIRKTNEFSGSKLFFLISKSVAISLSRKLLPEEIISKLSNKTISIKVGLYLEEWNLSIKDLFSTESEEEGELAEELEKLGEIDKKNKFDDLKADIIFTKRGLKIPIEITNTNPSSTGKFKQNRKSGIKSSLILSRLYFFVKWNIIHKSPTILILNKGWENFNWLKNEQNFMERFKCKIIFTDFKEDWARKVSQEINLLTEESLFNKTTRLVLE